MRARPRAFSMFVMELVPRTLSERTTRVVVAISSTLIASLSMVFVLSVANAAPVVLLLAASTAGAIALLARRAIARSWLTLTFAAVVALPVGTRGQFFTALVGGVVGGVLVRPVVAADAAVAEEGALDRFECVALAAARSLFAAGIFAIACEALIARVFVGLALVFALALVVVVVWRDRKRARFLREIFSGENDSYRIERDADVHGYEHLSPALSGMITDAVITRAALPATYRTSSSSHPIARVSSDLAKIVARLEKRTHFGATLVAVGSCSAALLAVMPLELAPSTSAARLSEAPLVVPACGDARAYFADRIESDVDGVGRAALLTHAQDASIPNGQGVILLVARTGKPDEAMRARVLETALAIPCRDKLALRVAEPTYLPLTLDATLTLERGADEASVRRDAEEQVRRMFQADARALDNDHVTFGESEKSFGYRARHALRQLPGVTKVHLLANGSDKDIPLAPTDFPTLASLTLHVTPR